MTCRKAPRHIGKNSLLLRWSSPLLATLFFLGALVSVRASEAEHATSAESAHEPAPTTHAAEMKSEPPAIIRSHAEVDEAPVSTPGVLGEIAGYSQLARKAVDQGKMPLAEYFLEKIVALPASEAERKDALLEIANTYEANQAHTKAIAIFEKISKLFPASNDQPERLLQLGRLYRASGANDLAISRFYNVLNTSLASGAREIDASRSLTRRAQAEIADTYFAMGDFTQAQRYYELLSRLELPEPERARVQFRIAHCLYVLGEVPRAGAAAQKFVADFPDDAAAPECRYLLAKALRDLKKPKEAYEQVLALLKEQQEQKDKAPEKWKYWQKKAGNEFANDLYQNGEYANALSIYQTLATIEATPDWQWPVVYQMGLCFEKLRLDRRAAEAYKFIIDAAAKPENKLAERPENVRNLVDMARWRGDQLIWEQSTGGQISKILGANPAAVTLPTESAALIPFR